MQQFARSALLVSSHTPVRDVAKEENPAVHSHFALPSDAVLEKVREFRVPIGNVLLLQSFCVVKVTQLTLRDITHLKQENKPLVRPLVSRPHPTFCPLLLFCTVLSCFSVLEATKSWPGLGMRLRQTSICSLWFVKMWSHCWIV